MRRMWVLAGAVALLAATVAAAATNPADRVASTPSATVDRVETVAEASGSLLHDHSSHDHSSDDHSALATASAVPTGGRAGAYDADAPHNLVDTAVCGPFQAVEIPGVGLACVHIDPVHDTAYSNVTTPSVPPYQPNCYGNGVSRNRVELIYAFVDGQPDRSAEVVPQIVHRYVPYIEGNVRRASAAAGTEFGVRFLMPNCQLQVTKVKLPGWVINAKTGGAPFFSIVRALYQKGFDRTDRKYLAWFDGSADGPACGTAVVAPDETPGPNNLHNGRPGRATPPERGGTILAPLYAVNFYNYGSCWGKGYDGAHTETHELFHVLGAVMLSAPNSDGAGHCVDAEDIMCYEPGRAPDRIVMSCMTMAKELDCNRDDYFNPRPVVGSYLSTHWNTARSNFLGPDPLDPVAAALPLP